MIDTHVHLWSLDRAECTWPTNAEAAIHRTFGMDDLRPILTRNGIFGAILVQSQEHADDTSWLLAIARNEPLVAGVVGWCDLEAHGAVERIVELATQPKLLGLRPMVQHREPGWYDRPPLDLAFAAMVDAGLALDALIRVPHLPALHRLALRHPRLSIVIDHAAKPAIGDSDAAAIWRDAIAPLAELPNVACKVSGLVTELRAGARPEAVAPYVSDLLALFGADRLMWGSDWPVVNSAADYDSWLGLAKSVIPSDDQDDVFSRTAFRVYGIPVAYLQ